MNFKDMFKKYIDGSASNEEKQLIEDELDKQELINNYLSEKLDNDLNLGEFNFDESHDINDDYEFTNKIKKTMRQTLRKLALLSATIVITFMLIAKFAVSPIMNSLYYDPSTKLDSHINQMELDVSTYTELHFPGVITLNVSVNELGYGSYDIKIDQSPRATYTGKIEKGNLKYLEENFYQFPGADAFKDGVYPYRDHRINGDKLEVEELSKMPETAVASAYFSFKEDISLEEVLKLMEKYPDTHFQWIAIRSSPKDVQQLPQFGINPGGGGPVISEQVVDIKKYPYFDLGRVDEEITSEILETHFKSLVMYMKEQEQYINLMGFDVEPYKNTLQYIKSEGIKSYGVLVSGKCDDLLELRNDSKVDRLKIDDIQLSYYSK